MGTMSMAAARGRRVIAADSAEEIGQIKGFVIERSGVTISKIHVAGRKSKAELLPWSEVTFGADAVMASGAGKTVEVDSDRELAAAKGEIELIGARVLDTDGFEHGTVTDVEFDPADGSIVMLHGEVDIAASQVHSLGSYAVVVELSG